MDQMKERSKRYSYVGIILSIAGVIFTTLLKEQVGIIGIIFIIIGGVFIATGINIKKSKH